MGENRRYWVFLQRLQLPGYKGDEGQRPVKARMVAAKISSFCSGGHMAAAKEVFYLFIFFFFFLCTAFSGGHVAAGKSNTFFFKKITLNKFYV